MSRRARVSNRSPEERLRIGRRICIGSEIFEIACCIGILFTLHPLTTAIVVVVVGGGMTGAYNVLFWRTMKKQALQQGIDVTSTL